MLLFKFVYGCGETPPWQDGVMTEQISTTRDREHNLLIIYKVFHHYAGQFLPRALTPLLAR
jgi:hypothetical protein